MVCFVCLFIVFFGTGLLVLVIGEINRKGRLQFKISLCLYKLLLEMIQREKLCSVFGATWLVGLV